jgi:hypothetical protein
MLVYAVAEVRQSCMLPPINSKRVQQLLLKPLEVFRFGRFLPSVSEIGRT